MIEVLENKSYDNPLFCPVCHEKVMPADDEDCLDPIPCNHTLFIACDDGFLYRSDLFDEIQGTSGVDNDDLVFEGSIDDYTSKLPIDNAVKIATYLPPPNFYGSYVGFKLEET